MATLIRDSSGRITDRAGPSPAEIAARNASLQQGSIRVGSDLSGRNLGVETLALGQVVPGNDPERGALLNRVLTGAQMRAFPEAFQTPQQQPQTGLAGTESALSGALMAALAGLQQGFGQGRGDLLRGQADIDRLVGSAQESLSPFVKPGIDASNLQAALSGALGPEQQAAAIANFKSSPGQEFLQNRGQQAVLRNAAALGGLGGGRVQQELQRQGIDTAQLDFSNNFARLGDVANRGFQATGLGTGLTGQQIGQIGQTSGQLANLGAAGGNAAANLIFNTGQSLGGARTRVGEQLAAATGGTSSALANLINNQGGQVSDVLGQGGSNIANLITNAGLQQSASGLDIAKLLAGISSGAAQQVVSLPGVPGIQQQQGILEGIGKAAGGIGTAIAASDIRLKQNIKRVGITPGGNNLYSWDWNKTGERLFGNQPTRGVIAQEVQRVQPGAVITGEHGYLMVDYNKVL